MRITLRTHFWKLRSIASLPRCHPASLVARLERRLGRKKVRRKIRTDDMQTAEEAAVAVTITWLSHSSGPKTVPPQAKRRSAKAKPPRSGGPKECYAILLMRAVAFKRAGDPKQATCRVFVSSAFRRDRSKKNSRRCSSRATRKLNYQTAEEACSRQRLRRPRSHCSLSLLLRCARATDNGGDSITSFSRNCCAYLCEHRPPRPLYDCGRARLCSWQGGRTSA